MPDLAYNTRPDFPVNDKVKCAMKWFIRLFFRTLRKVIGPFITLADKITTPKGIERSAEEQQRVDQQTTQLALYHFQTCPFCIKVRRHSKRLSLNIELRDAQYDPQSRQELLEGGGQLKVPCLRIVKDNGEVEWMYESNDIRQYLDDRFAA